MATTQIGTTLTLTGQSAITNYIVETDELGNADVNMEDVIDAAGQRVTRIIYYKDTKLKLNLICKANAAPATDFPEGAMCTVTGFTSYFVDSAPISRSKGAQKVTVSLTNIGIT